MNVAIHLKRQGIKSLACEQCWNDAKGQKLPAFFQETRNEIWNICKPMLTLPQVRFWCISIQKKMRLMKFVNRLHGITFSLIKELQKLAEKGRFVVFGTLASRNETTRKTLLKFLEIRRQNVFLM
jgi:fructokinase